MEVSLLEGMWIAFTYIKWYYFFERVLFDINVSLDINNKINNKILIKYSIEASTKDTIT